MKRSEDLQDYLKIYKNGLLDDTLPFWINNCIDSQTDVIFVLLLLRLSR